MPGQKTLGKPAFGGLHATTPRFESTVAIPEDVRPETSYRIATSLLQRASRPSRGVRRRVEGIARQVEAFALPRETVRRSREEEWRQCEKEFPQCELAQRQCELAGRRFFRAGPTCASISRHSKLAQCPGELEMRKWELAFRRFESKRRLGERSGRKCKLDLRPCEQAGRKSEKEFPQCELAGRKYVLALPPYEPALPRFVVAERINRRDERVPACRREPFTRDDMRIAGGQMTWNPEKACASFDPP
jgi:hypothetical protein